MLAKLKRIELINRFSFLKWADNQIQILANDLQTLRRPSASMRPADSAHKLDISKGLGFWGFGVYEEAAETEVNYEDEDTYL